MGRRPELDGLRGLAILLVLGDHLGLLPDGWMGVSLFFVLSGYLITSLLLAEHDQTGSVSLGGFYARRVARLYPALLVTLAAFYVLTRVVWPEHLHAVAAGDVVIVLLYVGNFYRGLRGGPAEPVTYAWSLALEEQFYLAWPPLLRRLLQRGVDVRRVAAGLLAVGAVIALARLAVGGNVGVAYYVLRGDELLLGCAAALAGAMVPRLLARAGAVLFVAVLALPFGPEWHTGWVVTGASVGAAGVLLTVLTSPAASRVFLTRPMRYVGRISYALYLWNGVLSGVWWGAHGEMLTGWHGLAGVGLAFTLAALSTHLLEEPIRRWAAQTKLKRRQTTSPVPESMKAHPIPNLSMVAACVVAADSTLHCFPPRDHDAK